MIKKFQQHHYQLDVIEQMARKFGPQVEDHAILKLPTGSGKTYVATKFLMDHFLTKGKKVLWVANRWAHINQFLKTLSDVKALNPGAQFKVVVVGEINNIVVKDLKFSPETLDDNYKTSGSVIYVSSIHTISSQIYKLDLYLKNKLDIAIFDEDHWGKNGGMRETVMDAIKGVSTLGLSATPVRPLLYDHKVDVIGHNYSYIKLADAKLLAKSVSTSVNTGITYTLGNKGLKKQEFNRMMKEVSINNVSRIEFIVNYYVRNINALGKTFIFCPNASNASYVASLLNQKLRNHPNFLCDAIISAGNTQQEYLKKIEAFRNHPGPGVLTSFGILCDGIDIPDLNSIFLTHETASDVKFAQMFGRGARTNDGQKMTFNLIDFQDNFLNGLVAKILSPDCPEFYGDKNFNPDHNREGDLSVESYIIPIRSVNVRNRDELEVSECLSKIQRLISEKIEIALTGKTDLKLAQIQEAMAKVITASLLVELKPFLFPKDISEMISKNYFDIGWDELEIMTSLVPFEGEIHSIRISILEKLIRFNGGKVNDRTLSSVFEAIGSDVGLVRQVIAMNQLEFQQVA